MITSGAIPEISAAAISGGYIFILMIVLIALKRLRGNRPEASGAFVSIIIAARNEAERITPCLESLEKLSYPQDKHEIIVIDDASTDSTFSIIHQFAEKHSNWQGIRIEHKSLTLKGKKNALLRGLSEAKGEIIFTTDADCIVPPNWISGKLRYFEKDVAMVQGYSPLTPQKGLFHKLLEFDNLFSIISIAVPTSLGYPFASIGRNLSYRRNAYDGVGGYQALGKFRSGDDTHLTELFRKKRKGRVSFCPDPDTFVLTNAPEDLKTAFNQQMRKNSRVFKKSFSSMVFTLFFFVSYMLPFAMLLAPGNLRLMGLSILGFRYMLEFFCLIVGANIFKQMHLVFVIPFMQLFYPFYNVFFSVLGSLQLYQWKK